ncbi:MAG: alginate lyase family protein [Marinobacter sp.]|nr:alginate lyase family protein [Marinobacter sp.]
MNAQWKPSLSTGGQIARTLVTTVLLSTPGVTSAEVAQCADAGLRPPAGYYQAPAASDGGDYNCESVPPFTDSLVFTSKYEGSDDARNELNQQAEQEYHAAVEKVRNFEKRVIAAADDYQVDGDGPAARACALSILDSWASADALLNPEVNHVGQAVRKWALTAAANGYLRVTRSGDRDALDPAQLARIRNWFDKLTTQIRKYYSDRPLRKVNNHDYWAAWAVMSAAVATQNCDDWDWALGKFDEAMGQVTDDGYLPNELGRNTRALEYMNFALQPLTLMTVFAEANHVGLHHRYQRKLNALATNVTAGLNDPGTVQAVTGYEQVTDGLYTAWSLAWMKPWQATWGDVATMPSFIDRFGPMQSTRLGGDLHWLYRIGPTAWVAGREPTAPRDVTIKE